MIKHIDILGTKYSVYFLPESELKMRDVDGYCERWSKEIFINETAFEDCEDLAKNAYLAKNKVLRHELIHAIFHEAGLDEYSEDETLVDAVANLFPKMQTIFESVECEK